MNYEISDDTIYLKGDYTKLTVTVAREMLIKSVKNIRIELINGSQLENLDSAGVALIDELIEYFNLDLSALQGFSEANLNKVNIFTVIGLPEEPKPEHETLLYKLGDYILELIKKNFEMIVLTSDIMYWSLIGLWDKKGQRKGTFTQQAELIGLNAIPIVGLLSFIIGLILSLQSAVQLRQFGADAFLANLLAFSLVREMSPLITAIILAGRSGSAIASEIATMKVTEELDALKMMALNPIRYVIVPKLHAVTLVMPLLVTFSIIIGLFGGVIIAVVMLGQSPSAFINSCINIVKARDFLLTIVKSTIFAWQIVVIGSHYGMQVRGGAEGVGKATTESVVASIFAVIIMDALFSLIYII